MVSVVSGGSHTLLLTAGGRLYAFGSNDHGQLGRGHTHSPLPSPADSAPKQKPKKTVEEVKTGDSGVGAGSGSAAAAAEPIDLDRYIRKYSSSKPAAALHNGNGAKSNSPAAAAGSAFSAVAALKQAKTKTADRESSSGSSAGAAATGPVMSEAERAAATSFVVEVRSFRMIPDAIVAVAAGKNHSLALTSEGGVYAWGRDAEGQCAVASGTASSVVATPRYVSALKGKIIIAIAACANMSAALTSTYIALCIVHYAA